MNSNIKLEDAINMESPSMEFLCDFGSNKYSYQVIESQLIDIDSDEKYLNFSFPVLNNSFFLIDDTKLTPEQKKFLNLKRLIQIDVPKKMFLGRGIKSISQFKIGDLPISNLTLVENYFLGDLKIFNKIATLNQIKPNTFTTWENEYIFTNFDNKAEMLEKEKIIFSDCFIFADGKMIIHIKIHFNII
jgi:hypothetical protein